MHKSTVKPLFFHIKRSKYWIRFILMTHFLSFAACLLNGLSLRYQMIMFLLVGVSLINQLSSYNKQTTAYLRYMDTNKWEFAPDKYKFFDIVATATILNPLLIVFFFKQGDAKKILLIFKDAMSDKEYRKLRVAIKMTSIG